MRRRGKGEITHVNGRPYVTVPPAEGSHNPKAGMGNTGPRDLTFPGTNVVAVSYPNSAAQQHKLRSAEDDTVRRALTPTVLIVVRCFPFAM